MKNEKFYEDLDYDSKTKLMQDWNDGKAPKVGSQNDRVNSCGTEGRTSLFAEPYGLISRDFAKGKQCYDDANAAASTLQK